MSDHSFSLDPVEVVKVDTSNRIIKTAIPAPGQEKFWRDYQRLSLVNAWTIAYRMVKGRGS